MPFNQTVPMLDGSTYKVSRLLASGKSNTKTNKSDKAGMGYLTYSLSLAPAHASGFQVCASASAACIAGCLYTSGYARIHPRRIQPARIAKTRLLRLNPQVFTGQLVREMEAAERKARKHDMALAVRLNVLSDVMWEREFPTLFSQFPGVQFYDYTKHYSRMLRYLRKELPANYHLTFSWSGTNREKCLKILEFGGNVAVPFHVKYRGDKRQPLPDKFVGRPIIDGDITDLRFLDPQGGYIVGLRVKGKAKNDHESGFVVEVHNGQAMEIN